MKRQTIKPSKGISRISFFIGILFSLFGVAMIIGALGSVVPMARVIVPFGVVWTSIAIFNTYRSYKNGFTNNSAPNYEIESYADEHEVDFEEKLRKLERLRKDGLITETEFKHKRSEILNDKW